MRIALVSFLLVGLALADPAVYFSERFETGEKRSFVFRK